MQPATEGPILSMPTRGPANGIVTRVIDGDTLAVNVMIAVPVHLRVHGINAPEKGTPAGDAAKKAVEDMLGPLPVHVGLNLRGPDKYGGRVLGDVTCDAVPVDKALCDVIRMHAPGLSVDQLAGVMTLLRLVHAGRAPANLGFYLVDAGHAKPWDGKGPKPTGLPETSSVQVRDSGSVVRIDLDPDKLAGEIAAKLAPVVTDLEAKMLEMFVRRGGMAEAFGDAKPKVAAGDVEGPSPMADAAKTVDAAEAVEAAQLKAFARVFSSENAEIEKRFVERYGGAIADAIRSEPVTPAGPTPAPPAGDHDAPPAAGKFA